MICSFCEKDQKLVHQGHGCAICLNCAKHATYSISIDFAGGAMGSVKGKTIDWMKESLDKLK